MGHDILDTGDFSPKERAILKRAARILEVRVRAEAVALNSPSAVREDRQSFRSPKGDLINNPAASRGVFQNSASWWSRCSIW